MGDTIKIETPEELGKLLGELKDKVDATSLKVEEAAKKSIEEPEFVAALRTQQDELKTQNELFLEKIKTLEVAFKARGTWKDQDTPMAKAYGLGNFVNWMIRGRNGKSTVATQELIKMGGRPMRETDNPDEMIKISTGMFEKTNPTVSASPLASDEADSNYGSYLIPVEYGAELGRVAADASAMMGLVTHMPMRGITKYLPTTTDALTFTKLTDQETAKTEDTLVFGRVTLTACTYAFWLAITEEMDEDSLIGLGELVRTMAGEAWGNKFDDLALDDSSYGALQNASVNSLVMDTGDVSYSDLDINYLDNLIAKLTTQNKRQGARYFFHPTVFDYIRQEKDAQGRYIFQDAVNAAPATIRGYPFTISDGMPPASESSASDEFVLFGNPRYIVAGDRTGFEFRIFDQTIGTMQYDQIYLRAKVRQAMVTWIPTALAKLVTAAS